MLESLIRWCIAQRWLVMLLMGLVVALGLHSYTRLPVDAVVDITNVQVVVNTQAPGYSPLETEQRVTFPIETAMAGLPGLSQTRSLSRYGLSQVTVIFRDGTDLHFARQLVNQRLLSVYTAQRDWQLWLDAVDMGGLAGHRSLMFDSYLLALEAAIDGQPDDKTGPLLEPILQPLWEAYRTMKIGRDARSPLAIESLDSRNVRAVRTQILSPALAAFMILFGISQGLFSIARGTIPLSLASFAIGLVIALGMALLRLSRNVVLRGIARFYISVIRGTPLLVQLFVIFYGLPAVGVVIDPFPAAVIAFSLNVGGYAAEVIRAAILSVPRGQWEAAHVVGLSRRKTLTRIILPQAARVSVPPLSNTFISLVKDSSLASLILVTELFRQAQNIAAFSYEFMAVYLEAALIYWLFCLVLSAGQGVLERRLDRHVAR